MDCEARAFEFPARIEATPVTGVPPRCPRPMTAQAIQTVRPTRLAVSALVMLFTSSRAMLFATAQVRRARDA
ncbi:MAG TPA: hypothetical protein VHZ32_01475 [Rhizomicrobium sp.]|jgi:hypothetical protein|nr:hypothetical protein [Rhizomicrobium sp.]